MSGVLRAPTEEDALAVARQGAVLGVDAESLTGANRLYEQAGMRVAARFDIYEKAVA